MTSKPGSRKSAPKTPGRARPALARPAQPAAQATRSKRGEKVPSLEARRGALESAVKQSPPRLPPAPRRRERAESKLRQSEARFQSLTAFGDHHLFVMDAQGRYLFSNREQSLSVGGERMPLVGRNQREFHPREVAELYEDRVRAVLETGRAVEFEHSAPEPDGQHLHQDTLYPIEEGGRIVALGGICRDVTGQKNIQHRLQHALDATAEGVWDWNIRTGEVVFSRNWKTSLGYSPDEVPDRVEFWESIIHPEDLPRVRQALDDHFAGRSPVYLCENRLRMKSGEYRANLDRGKVVDRDASGQPLRMVGTDSDISERRKALDDLLQAKNDLEAIFNAIRQAVFLMEPEGLVVSANEEVARRLGCEAKDLVGRSIYEFLPPDTAAGRRRRVEEVLRSGRPVQFEDVRAGRTILQTVYPVFDSHGAVVRLAVYGQDVTEERCSEVGLRESEERYRRIVETANEGVWAMDSDCVTTYVNRRMADMLGYRPEEMVGRRVDTFMFAEDHRDHSAQMTVREAGGNSVYERRFRCRDGRELWTTVSATALKDAAGGFAGSFAMFTDITRRKRAEEQMELQGLVLDQAQDHVTITNLDGVIRYVNQAECRALRRSRSELIGRHVSILGEDPDRGATQREIIESTLSKGEWRGEVINHSVEGSESIIDLRTFMVRSSAGKAIAMCGIGTDITEHKHAEVALRESETLLRTTMASTAEGVLVVDLEGRVLLASQRFNELWRIPQGLMAEGRDETLLRHVVGQLVEPDAFLERVRRLYAADAAALDTIRFKDGRVLERFSLPLVRGGKIAGRTWSFRDVTARVQAEAELRQSQAKLRDLYQQLQKAREEERRRISRELHDELGQNITALKIDLAWLAHRVDPGRPALRQKLDSMGGLVDATLDTVRRVSAELRPGVLDSLGLAAAAEWLVRDFEQRTEVACDICITPDEIAVPPGLATDVFRILQETLTNVARHAQASRVEVTLVQKADMLELNVIDNGIGIPADRVSSSDSFGLLGIRERLLPYRAALRVEGLPGGGTAVRVAIPIEAKAD